MKYIHIGMILTSMLFTFIGTQAQQGFSCTGGTVVSAGIELSYTAGILASVPFSGATAQVFPGVQVPAGCTDPAACNYNPAMLVNDGSCIYVNCPGFEGCTNPNAENYHPGATIDDGSCIVGGCTYSQASNFDVLATFDDGSCAFDVSCPTDFNNDGLTAVSDLLFFISYYGTACE